MLKEMQEFSTWSKEAQAACVCLYGMAHDTVITTPAATPKRTITKWTDADREALFSEFDAGNFNWRALAKRFGRTTLAVKAQYTKVYLLTDRV